LSGECVHSSQRNEYKPRRKVQPMISFSRRHPSLGDTRSFCRQIIFRLKRRARRQESTQTMRTGVGIRRCDGTIFSFYSLGVVARGELARQHTERIHHLRLDISALLITPHNLAFNQKQKESSTYSISAQKNHW
jgi:hypothetical protein